MPVVGRRPTVAVRHGPSDGEHDMRHRAGARSEQQPSFDELLSRVRDLPEGQRGNILHGEVHVVQAPSPARGHTLAELSAALVAGSPLGDPVPAGWSFLNHVEVALRTEGLLVADIAGWRMPSGELAACGAPVRVTPAWVCEVLGGASKAFTLTAKRRAWAELGVESLWVADPEAEVLESYVNHRGKWLLFDAVSDERAVGIAPFEAFRLDAGDFWVPTTPPPSRRGEGPTSRRSPRASR